MQTVKVKQPKFRTPEQVYALWLKALRSGKYKQTRSDLKNSEGFCCLGVLCDLAAKDGGNMQWEIDSDRHHLKFNDGEYGAMPPEEILNYIGLCEFNTAGDLAVMNDKGKSFKQIANHIEKKIIPKALTAAANGYTI